ncbi:MAG: hypothetical protein HY904_20080 [Deltaproteobacteria bacterium]|nr:hypothetical protein [Deltaproteobacteria bacterium]
MTEVGRGTPPTQETPGNPDVNWLAERLAETDEQAKEQLRNALVICAPEVIQSVLAETDEVERGGGLLTADGQRRRTVCGVFFHLLRKRLTREEWKRLAPAAPPAAPQPTKLMWPARAPVVSEALARPGECLAMVTAWAPPRARVRTGHVVVPLESPVSLHGVSRALPRPDESPPMVCNICVAEWQWMHLGDRVRRATLLQADGVGFLNDAKNAMVVLSGEVELDTARASGREPGATLRLSGTPGNVIQVGNCSVTAMVGRRQPPPHRGLPTMSRTPTVFVVYVPTAEWRAAQQQPGGAQYVFRGRFFPDQELGAVAVLADSVERLPQA